MNTLHKPYKYIDTDKALADLNELMLTTGRIAIDIEADSLHHYYEKVCLIQFTIKNKNFIVDPLAKLDLTSFLNILASKPLILHDAGYDLRMLRSSFGFITESDIFDTMLAAQLLGYERLGLVALIQELCDISLSKQDQKSNWSKRPLTLDQLQYASDDTFYLHELADILRGKLKKLNRLHWHEQACKKMISSAAIEKPPVDPDTVLRIKGSSHLDHFQLTILRAVWHWRDQQARAADLPPFKIMGNQTIITAVGRRDDDGDHLTLQLRQPGLRQHQLVVSGHEVPELRLIARIGPQHIGHEAQLLLTDGEIFGDVLVQSLLIRQVNANNMVGLRHGDVSLSIGAIFHPTRKLPRSPARIGALRLAYRLRAQNIRARR